MRATLEGETPLHDAVNAESHSRVAELLAQGADPNVENAIGIAPLALTVGMGALGLATLLLGYGAEITRGTRTSLQLSASGASSQEEADERLLPWKPLFLGFQAAPKVLACAADGPAFLAAFEAAVAEDAYPCRAVERLVQLLTGPDEAMRGAAEQVLYGVLHKGWDSSILIARLAARAEHEDAAVRKHALTWLCNAAEGGAPLHGAVASLARVLASGEVEERKSAALSLGLAAVNGADISAAFEVAKGLLAPEHEASGLRYFVARMLLRASMHGHDLGALVPSLEAVGQDADPDTLEACTEALSLHAERAKK